MVYNSLGAQSVPELFVYKIYFSSFTNQISGSPKCSFLGPESFYNNSKSWQSCHNSHRHWFLSSSSSSMCQFNLPNQPHPNDQTNHRLHFYISHQKVCFILILAVLVFLVSNIPRLVLNLTELLIHTTASGGSVVVDRPIST